MKNQEKIFALQDKLYADAKEGLILSCRLEMLQERTVLFVMSWAV